MQEKRSDVPIICGLVLKTIAGHHFLAETAPFTQT